MVNVLVWVTTFLAVIEKVIYRLKQGAPSDRLDTFRKNTADWPYTGVVKQYQKRNEGIFWNYLVTRLDRDCHLATLILARRCKQQLKSINNLACFSKKNILMWKHFESIFPKYWSLCFLQQSLGGIWTLSFCYSTTFASNVPAVIKKKTPFFMRIFLLQVKFVFGALNVIIQLS